MSILDERAAKAIQEAMDARVRALSVKSATSHMAEVIEIDAEGVTWVHIFGGADRTPAIRTLAKVKKGDLVTVTIEEGSVTITGSPSSPSASVEYVDKANNEIVSYAKDAIAGILGDVIQVKSAIIERATIEDLTAVEATIETLTGDYARLNELVADKADIVDLTAATGRISQLEADNVTVNGKITAAEGRIGTIESDYLKTQDMDAEVARVGTLLTGYAEADLANVNNAWIENGVIKDAAITNEMVGSLSANKLTAGTINGANINVTNLNADNITAGTINGQRIGTGSLSLDKLSEDVYTESEVDSIVDGLNDRIDGAIETHTGTVVPTLNNSPASSWNTTDLKDEHVGDVYYVVNSQSQQNGYCYRFTKSGSTYSWQLIKDSDVTAALSRLQTAEGKIGQIETFDSTVSSFMTNTDSELTSVKNRTTSLETRVTTAEGNISNKVDSSTFNTVSQKVDANEANITSLSTVVTNNGLTESTNITNTVNSVSQTATGNSSKISQLTTTLGTNADGTTKAGDIVHRTSAVEQDLSGFKTTVSQTYASKTSVEAAQADATNALNRQVAYSATSSTGASTAAKVATCTQFPALAAGVTVTVRFSVANTSTGAVTLNVNSTGAKTIYVNGAATAAGNQMLWAANANVTFTYDGTYWRVVSEPRTWYGTCGTAAATAAKTATINEIVVCKGTVVKLNTTYENTSTSATMNITSTGAKNLYYGTTTTRPTTANGYGWGAASTATFVFDGQYWRVGDTSVLSRLIQAETTISSHTTSINQNAEAIEAKANATDVYTKTETNGLISTEVTNRNAAITAASNSITASVEETYATKTALADGLEDANDYTDSEISSAKAEIKVTTDGISSEVSKISSAKYVNSSAASWTLPNIKTYAAEGHSEGWNVTSTSGLRVGDTVYVKGTDSTRNCTVYIKTTVTEVSSATRFVGTSHGYEDVLPVETIKSTINQSSDSVKIQAKHVEIDGAAIFSNTAFRNAADAAYDAKGAAATVQTNLDNMEVGGRNLLLGSSDISSSDFGSLSSSPIDGGTRGSSKHIESSNAWNGIGIALHSVLQRAGAKIGDSVTLSIWVSNLSEEGVSRNIYLYRATSSSSTPGINNPGGTNTYTTLTLKAGEWQRVWCTFKVTDYSLNTNKVTRFETNTADTTNKMLWTAPMLEFSTKPSPWTPAPEDMASASDAVEYIVGTQTAATGSWTGVTRDSSLYAGKTIAYKLPYAGSGNASLQLKDSAGSNVGGNIAVYLNTTRVTTHFGANSVIQMTYDGTYWRVTAIPNSNDTARYVQYYNSILAGENLTAASIIGGRSDGKFYKLSGSGDYFELSYPLLWTTAAISSGGTNYANIYTQCYDRNLGTYYTSFNTGGINKLVYMVGTVVGNKFTLYGSTSATYLTCNEPTSENGLFYIPIGRLGNQSNGKNYFNFQVAVPITLYAYIDGKFRQVTPTEVVAEQQIYIQASSVSDAPTAPTAWVEESGESITYGTQDDASTITTSWTVKHPTYDRNRPVTFVATQRKRLDGTITCSNPLPDDTTTIIDGGNIITHSIQAHAIESNSLKLSNFNSEVTDKLADYDNAVDGVSSLSNQVASMSKKTALIDGIQTRLTEQDGKLTTITNSFRVNNGKLELTTDDGSESTSVELTSTKLAFMNNNNEVASIGEDKLDIQNAEVHGTLAFGGFAFIPRSNGNLSLKWIGA